MSGDPWQCPVCGEWFPVPSLARDHCETKETEA